MPLYEIMDGLNSAVKAGKTRYIIVKKMPLQGFGVFRLQTQR